MNQPRISVYDVKGHRGDAPIEGFIGVDGQRFLGFIDDSLPKVRTIRGNIENGGTQITFSIPLSFRVRYVVTLQKRDGTEGVQGTYVGQGSSVLFHDSKDGLVARIEELQHGRPVDHVELKIMPQSEPNEGTKTDWLYRHLGNDCNPDQ